MGTETQVSGRTELVTESRDNTLDSGEYQQTNRTLSYLDTRGMLMMAMSKRDAEMLILAATDMSQSLHGIRVEMADDLGNEFYVTEEK
jgi:hypothetical protein